MGEARYEVREEDVEYAAPAGEPLLARIYRPVGAPGRRAALVDVHGGAWSNYDRTVDWTIDHSLAALGIVVVAIDFRQAPAHRYPSSVADVVASIRFVKANAETLGIDAERVGLVGGSSGGHLVLLAAIRPNAREYGTTPVVGVARPSEIDPSVACALPLWPIADPIARYRYLLERRANPYPARDPIFRLEPLVFGHETFFGDEATMTRASVPRIVASGEAERLPPIWVAHAELDENVTLPMTERLVETYRKAGGAAELEVFPGVGHSFANFPGEAAERAIAKMADFVRRQSTSA